MEENWGIKGVFVVIFLNRKIGKGEFLNRGHYIFERENGATLLPRGSLVFISYILALIG